MKSLKYLNKYFIKYKWRLLVGIFITILSKILALQIPIIIRKSLNSVEDFINNDIIDKSSIENQLFWNLLTIVGVAVLAGLLTFVMRQMIIVTSRLIEFDLKNERYFISQLGFPRQPKSQRCQKIFRRILNGRTRY